MFLKHVREATRNCNETLVQFVAHVPKQNQRK